MKFGGLHVIREPAKRGVAPPGIDGIAARLSQSTQSGHVPVNDTRCLQTSGQAFSIELRIVPRPRDGSYIHQLADTMRMQDADEFIDWMCGVTHRRDLQAST